MAKPDRACRGCGKRIRRGTSFCADCAEAVTREHFDAGRKSAQSPEHLAKRAFTMVRHRRAIQNWNPGDIPHGSREIFTGNRFNLHLPTLRVTNTVGAGRERAVRIGHPGGQAYPASTALGDFGGAGRHVNSLRARTKHSPAASGNQKVLP